MTYEDWTIHPVGKKWLEENQEFLGILSSCVKRLAENVVEPRISPEN